MVNRPDRPDRGRQARWVSLQVPDAARAWAAAGFTVVDDTVTIGDTLIRLSGAAGGRRGIQAAEIDGLDLPDGSSDGLDIRPPAHPESGPPSPVTHPNGITGIDHVVALTPDLDRTVGALEATGLALRRIRRTDSQGSPMRQAFFRVGSVILEVVGGETGSGLPAEEAPATWFGLAVTATDLDRLAPQMGDALGPIRAAVQPGRRIATVRGRELGVSVALAVMDDHADRLDQGDH